MPETIPPTEESANNTNPTLENKDGANGDATNGGDKTNQDYAAERLAAKAKKLETENEALTNRLKEFEMSGKPDDEQLESEFHELAMEKVLRGVNQDKFNKLPKSIQNRIIADPFKFVDQEELEKAIADGKGKRERYNLAAKYAIKEIESLVEDDESATGDQPDEKKADPTISKNGDNEKLTGLSRAELIILSQTDPEKFERVKRAMKV